MEVNTNSEQKIQLFVFSNEVTSTIKLAMVVKVELTYMM